VNKRKMKSYRNLLEGRLAVLVDTTTDTVESMTSERPPNHADPTDRASHETDRSFTLRMRDRDRRLIAKIEDALKRIEEGTFGTCNECGESISEARLKARPVTTLCIDCKEEAELRERAS
jgi:DnaK suppressor protein